MLFFVIPTFFGCEGEGWGVVSFLCKGDGSREECGNQISLGAPSPVGVNGGLSEGDLKTTVGS